MSWPKSMFGFFIPSYGKLEGTFGQPNIQSKTLWSGILSFFACLSSTYFVSSYCANNEELLAKPQTAFAHDSLLKAYYLIIRVFCFDLSCSDSREMPVPEYEMWNFQHPNVLKKAWTVAYQARKACLAQITNVRKCIINRSKNPLMRFLFFITDNWYKFMPSTKTAERIKWPML